MIGYDYTAYGLHIRSEFEIPELQVAAAGAPDVTIGYGALPASLPNPSGHGIAWESEGSRLLLTVPDVARYLISDESEVTIEAFPGSSAEDVRMFLLGSALGALLHERRILVLHASVIQTARGAVLFMGKSGSGKSTLARAFLRRGYPILTDDKAGVVLDTDGRPAVLPGMPFSRLTEDAVRKLGIPVNGARPNAGLGKYVLPIDRFCTDSLRVHAAYAMSPHNRPEIRVQPIRSLERFETLRGQIYRGRFVRSAGQREAAFRTLGALAAGTAVSTLRWPDHPCRIDALVNRIEEDLG